MTTASGLVFFGDDARSFEAVDAATENRYGISIQGKTSARRP